MTAEEYSVVSDAYYIPGTDCSFYEITILDDAGTPKDPTDDYVVAEGYVDGHGCGDEGLDDGNTTAVDPTPYTSHIAEQWVVNDCDHYVVDVYDNGLKLASDTLSSCQSTKMGISSREQSELISLYPTKISNQSFHVTSASPLEGKLIVVEANGRIVKTCDLSLLPGEEKIISLPEMNSGIYLVNIYQKQKLTFKQQVLIP